jgi:nucleoside-diphosphate-sugar epimerase
MAKLVIGCGYLGHRVALRWQAAGKRVLVTTRSARRAETLRSEGFEPIVLDVTHPCDLSELPKLSSVLYAVGFDRSAGHGQRDVYVKGLNHVLAALSGRHCRILYISSTGVYGQSDGSWVDERSVCQPTRDGGRVCLEAEGRLATHPLGAGAVILRMAGLYGPGRIPLQKLLMDGQPIPVPEEGYLNLIHVDDAAEVVLAAEAKTQVPRWFVVSDGNPVWRKDYYEELARRLGAPLPRFVPPPADSTANSRASSSKRICNRRMTEELEVRFRYPTFREGLAAILDSGEGSQSGDRGLY